MRVSRVSGVAVLALIAGLLAPVGAAYADPPAPPYSVVTSPADASTATAGSPIAIAGEGHLDPLGVDSVVSLQLDVNAEPVSGQVVTCGAGPSDTPFDCYGDFSYTPPAAGNYALQVDLITSGADVLSPVVTVTVPAAAPSLTFTTAPPSPATGVVEVGVTGSTDPASPDLPAAVDLAWGSTDLGSVPCPGTPDPHGCPVSFEWDSTGLNATHDLVATMTTTGPSTATAVQASVAAVNHGPTVSITDPATDNTAQVGHVSVTATADVGNRQNDHPESMRLYLGSTSTPVSPVTSCSGTGTSCTLTFDWDGTGKTGSQLLIVGFRTTRGKTSTDSVHVIMSNPAPTVVITAPVAGSTVTGPTSVTATGTVDSRLTDAGDTMKLYVGGVLVDTKDCPAASRSCPVALSWDASGQNGNRDLTVVFQTTSGATKTSAVTTVRATTAPPVAAVTLPANGATVSGPLSIVTTGSITLPGDSATSLQLLIDGVVTSATPSPCSATPCSVTYGWDTTGLNGSHTLQAKFVTRKGFSALSPVTTINIVSPLPTAVILSPTTSSTVHRTAVITVSGAVDATQTDSPSSIRLTLDGSALGGVLPCAPAATTPRVCDASYSWNTFGLTGRHTLVATVVSAKGVVGTSSATSVYVYAGTATVIAPLKATRAGRSVTYTGRVTTLVNKLGVPGVKVLILLRPSVGKSRKLYVLTNVHGFFKVAFKPSVNTTIEATVVTLPFYGTSHTFSKLHVVPTFKCSVGTSVRRNALDSGSCTVANLPKTTKVSLQYEFNGHWYTLGSGRAKGSRLSFSFRFANRGTYRVRVVLSTTSVFAGATGPSLKVAVT